MTGTLNTGDTTGLAAAADEEAARIGGRPPSNGITGSLPLYADDDAEEGVRESICGSTADDTLLVVSDDEGGEDAATAGIEAPVNDCAASGGPRLIVNGGFDDDVAAATEVAGDSATLGVRARNNAAGAHAHPRRLGKAVGSGAYM